MVANGLCLTIYIFGTSPQCIVNSFVFFHVRLGTSPKGHNRVGVGKAFSLGSITTEAVVTYELNLSTQFDHPGSKCPSEVIKWSDFITRNQLSF